MATETFQTPSKEARDKLYEDLRANGTPEEKQCVRYSEPVQENGVWKTAWFVAHPAAGTY